MTRKLIVFDLDETLVYASLKWLPNRKHDFRFKEYYIYKRDGVDYLLHILHATGYETGIFSAAQREYVLKITTELYKPHKFRPLFVLSGEDCESKRMHAWTEDKTGIISLRTMTYHTIKPLQKIHRLTKIPLCRILIVDDLPLNSAQNADQYVQIATFDPEQNPTPDPWLYKLAEYLTEIISQQTTLCESSHQSWFKQVT